MLDQVTKRLKIQKSFEHVFSGDFAFLYIRGKPTLDISTKFAVFDQFFLKHDFSSSFLAFLERENMHTCTFSGLFLLRPCAFTDHYENLHGNKYTSCELKYKFS